MFFKRYVSDLTNATVEVRFLRIMTAFVVVLCLLEAVAILRLIGAEKTIITPPSIKRSFWVSGAEMSKEYLEEMAYWYAGLVLTVTPQSAEYQNSLFLKYAAPSETGRLTAEMGARAKFLRKHHTATQFTASGVTPDVKNLRVAITGSIITWVGDKKAAERRATYMIGFKNINGMLHVVDFRESDAQHPFTPAAAPAQDPLQQAPVPEEETKETR